MQYRFKSWGEHAAEESIARDESAIRGIEASVRILYVFFFARISVGHREMTRNAHFINLKSTPHWQFSVPHLDLGCMHAPCFDDAAAQLDLDFRV